LRGQLAEAFQGGDFLHHGLARGFARRRGRQHHVRVLEASVGLPGECQHQRQVRQQHEARLGVRHDGQRVRGARRDRISLGVFALLAQVVHQHGARARAQRVVAKRHHLTKRRLRFGIAPFVVRLPGVEELQVALLGERQTRGITVQFAERFDEAWVVLRADGIDAGDTPDPLLRRCGSYAGGEQAQGEAHP
jgi:hypothetical protein